MQNRVSFIVKLSLLFFMVCFANVNSAEETDIANYQVYNKSNCDKYKYPFQDPFQGSFHRFSILLVLAGFSAKFQ